MIARNFLAPFLVLVFLSVPFTPALSGAASDFPGVVQSADTGGMFTRILEFARGIFTSRQPLEKAGENDDHRVFSKNPYVYVAAFWVEIVNAPKETGFLERIMAFLEAVKVKRSRRSWNRQP